jgi:hypothetical protein
VQYITDTPMANSDLTISSDTVRLAILRSFGVTAKPTFASSVKLLAIQLIFGPIVLGYQKLESYLKRLCIDNPGFTPVYNTCI